MSIKIIIMVMFLTLFNVSCSQPQKGIFYLDEKDKHVGKPKSKVKADLHKQDATFKKAVVALEKQLITRNKEKAKNNEIKKEAKALKEKYLKKSMTNLEQLGVYNIKERLSKPLGKYVKYSSSKKNVFVKKINSSTDRLGGKLVCNKQVLTFRIDRSIFITCMENYDKKTSFSYEKLFTNYSLMNIMQHQVNDTPSICKVKLAVSHNSYNDLAHCLIQDRASGGFFKFRNPNSLSYKFKIIKDKN